MNKWKSVRTMGLGFLLLGMVAHAQEGTLVVHPPLSESFPLKAGPDGVRLQFRVLLNDHAILGPEAVLRFVYVDPNAGIRPHGGGDSEHSGPGARRDNFENTGMDTAVPQSPTSVVNPQLKPVVDTSDKSDKKGSAGEIKTEVWNQPGLFREALDHATDLGTTVVYGLPGKTRPESAVIDFPEGMFLGEAEAKVRVLALTDDSRARKGGVAPGDEIRSLDGKPVATLEDFIKAYLAIKQAAKESSPPSYTIEVWRPGEAKTVSIRVEAPPSIHSLL